MKRTLYDVLQVDKQASPEHIAAACRAQKEKLGTAADHDSQNELKLVQEAFAILSDPQQRSRYDQRLNTEISHKNSVIFYSKTSSTGRLGTRLFFLLIIFIAGIAAYQRYFEEPTNSMFRDERTTPSFTQTAAIQQTVHQTQSVTVYTDLHDLAAIPYLTNEGKARYLEFLAHASPRAFVICKSGRFSIAYGFGKNVLTAAMKNTLQFVGDTCKPYAVNDKVVWATNLVETAGVN